MRFIGVSLLVLVTMSFSSDAGPLDRLSTTLGKEIERVQRSLEAPSSEEESSDTTNWKVQNIYLRVNASVGFKIPAVANLTLVPQIELVWHRLTP